MMTLCPVFGYIASILKITSRPKTDFQTPICLLGEESCSQNSLSFFTQISLLLCGPILPCVQTVCEEARPNIIPIHTNGARKGPAQYPV